MFMVVLFGVVLLLILPQFHPFYIPAAYFLPRLKYANGKCINEAESHSFAPSQWICPMLQVYFLLCKSYFCFPLQLLHLLWRYFRGGAILTKDEMQNGWIFNRDAHFLSLAHLHNAKNHLFALISTPPPLPPPSSRTLHQFGVIFKWVCTCSLT